MRAVDAICEILKREGTEFLSCFPTTPIIEAAARAGIRPVICRQERIGVGIADGFSRVSNGRRIGVFAMQSGPGAENAFAGIATAYSDSVPVLLLPGGYPRNAAQVHHHFRAVDAYAPVTKWVEEINVAGEVSNVMRRAFTLLKMGRPGPVLVELPADVANEDIAEPALSYTTVKRATAGAGPKDVQAAARALVQAKTPVIYAGHGVLYAEASDELAQLAELLQAPVMTTLEGKSAFPEDHPLALGLACNIITAPAAHFLHKADLVFAIGSSLTRHGITTVEVPPGKTIVQVTNDERDINKQYTVDYPVLGDARVVLAQFVDAVKDLLGPNKRRGDEIAVEIEKLNQEWLENWRPRLTSSEVPINPYRVMWELMRAVDPKDAIVTADSGSPRNQLAPFYKSAAPRSYLGWGKSHALGSSLGLILGAKLAAPDKFCVNFMGDAAFGETGLDFETGRRCGIPILTIVLNNSTMAAETAAMAASHDRYRTRDLGGNYAEIGRALGGYAERIENPDEIAPAIKRARKATEDGQPALLEFITKEEFVYCRRDSLKPPS
jgi:thiamine pyrophosphate-dependent acetolactate synthase large subunit-like protein